MLAIKKHSSKLKSWSLEMPNAPYSNRWRALKKMRTLALILTLTGFSFSLFSQELDDKNVTDFYYQTFNDYFSNKSQLNENSTFYVQADSIKTTTLNEFIGFKVHFVNKNQAQELIRSNKISELYWAKIEEISKDTIDVLIGGWSVIYEKKFLKKGIFRYAAWCGGTNGYVPQGRFIYNYETIKWAFIPEKEIGE